MYVPTGFPCELQASRWEYPGNNILSDVYLMTNNRNRPVIVVKIPLNH